MTKITGSDSTVAKIRTRVLKQLEKEMSDKLGVKLEGRLSAKVRRKIQWTNTDFKYAEATVICHNPEKPKNKAEKHRVAVSKKGRLIFYNHSKEEMNTWLAMRSLGSNKTCRCLTILRHWIRFTSVENTKTTNPASIPEELHLELYRAKIRGVKHGRSRYDSKTKPADQLRVPLKSRASFLAKVLKKSLRASSLYSSPVNAAKFIKEADLLLTVGHDASNSERIKLELPLVTQPGQLMQEDDGNSKPWLQRARTLNLPVDWYDNYYRKGMAVIGGCVATHVSPISTPVASAAYSVTQGRSVRNARLVRLGLFNKFVHKAYCMMFGWAKIVQDDDGVWRILEL